VAETGLKLAQVLGDELGRRFGSNEPVDTRHKYTHTCADTGPESAGLDVKYVNDFAQPAIPGSASSAEAPLADR